MITTTPLRCALATNGLFSSLCGAVMLAWPTSVGDWLGLQATLVLQLLGAGLLLFAGDLFFQATRQRMTTWRALGSSIADALWVVATVVLLPLFPNVLSPLGHTLALAVAVIVFCLGAWQIWGIKRAHCARGSDVYRHCLVVSVDASAEAMWRVIGPLGNIAEYAPSLEHSQLDDDVVAGVGAIRTCRDVTGKQWSEKCTAYEPGRSFSLQFLADAPDFPFPAKSMHGGWEVLPAKDFGSEVKVWWELTPQPRLLAPVIIAMLGFMADRQAPRIIRNMAASTLPHRSNTTNPAKAFAITRLVPRFC